MAWDASWDSAVEAANITYKLSPGLLRALIRRESNDDPSAVGDSGLARGLCQMHPTACQTVGKDWDRQSDPLVSIDSGAAYLAWCHNVTGDWTWALGAYNQGPTTISRALHYAEDVLARVTPSDGGA